MDMVPTGIFVDKECFECILTNVREGKFCERSKFFGDLDAATGADLCLHRFAVHKLSIPDDRIDVSMLGSYG